MWRAPIASSNSQRPISHSTSFNPRLSSKWITKPRIVRILVFNRGCESHRSAFRGPSLVRPPGSGQPNFPDDCLHKYQTLHPGRLDGCRDKGLEHLSALFLKATTPLQWRSMSYSTKPLSFSHGGRTKSHLPPRSARQKF